MRRLMLTEVKRNVRLSGGENIIGGRLKHENCVGNYRMQVVMG